MLETDVILNWHDSEAGQEEPWLAHANLNYHASAYENLEHYLRSALKVLSQPKESLKQCLPCLEDTLKSLPDYLRSKVQVFYDKVKPCSEPLSPITGKSLT